MKEHKNNVLLSLQSKLADTSLNFKDTLEEQSEVNYINPCRREMNIDSGKNRLPLLERLK
jgi:hypothetical protein